MRYMRTGALAAMTAGLLMAGLAGGVAAQSPAPAGGLENTDWLLTAVGTSPVASGVNANLLLASKEASGFAGCNRFFGSYTSDGTSTLTFGPIGQTMKSCDDATNAFESSYLTALASVTTYKEGTGTLDLADKSGATVLSYAATAPATVEGPWNVTHYNNGKGAVENVSADFAPSMAFDPDGLVQGFDGCNNFSGGYGVNGSAITIGPLMGTMMACPDPINAQAFAFLTALQAATTWSVSAGTLDLRDSTGAQQVEATSAIGH
jgi:heat shock protein HslJ